jgi:hypothetical protein
VDKGKIPKAADREMRMGSIYKAVLGFSGR